MFFSFFSISPFCLSELADFILDKAKEEQVNGPKKIRMEIPSDEDEPDEKSTQSDNDPMLKLDAGSRQSHLGSHVHPRWDPAFSGGIPAEIPTGIMERPRWDPTIDPG